MGVVVFNFKQPVLLMKIYLCDFKSKLVRLIFNCVCALLWVCIIWDIVHKLNKIYNKGLVILIFKYK